MLFCYENKGEKMFKKISENIEEFRKKISKEIYADTKYYQKIYKFKIGEPGEHDTWNNESDAFKHTYGSALLSLKYNSIKSLLIGYFHEIEGNFSMGQSTEEEIMDTHNNHEGRKIADEIKKDYPNWEYLPERKLKDIIAKKVMGKMNKGLLVRDLIEAEKYQQQSLIQQILEMYKDYQKQQFEDYIENILKQKYLNQVPIQQNLKSQSRKPLSMNFAELIRQPQALAPQTLAPQELQFNMSQTALKNPSLKYNYGKNGVSTNNNMQFQDEKMPSLYNGSGIKQQTLSTGGGQPILNSGSNVPIRDIKYNNLPEFKPMNIPLENNPIFNFGTTNYTKGNFVAANNGNNFDMNGILKLSMKILEQYISGRTGQDSDKTQPQQYYEFIPE